MLDVTIVNIALPSIQSQLHESPADLEWVITAYTLALAALIPVSGTLGDQWGRRRLFVVGMALFTAGSMACAVSGTAVELTVFRGVQGVGGAVMSALTLAILSAAYPAGRRAGAIGIWATASGLGFGLGPVAGGLLIESFGWSSIFWVNVPLGIADLILTILVVPESRNPAPRALNVPSVMLAALGLAALTLGFTSLSSDPITSPLTLSSLAAGAALACLFVWNERHCASPMIPAALIRSRPFDVGCAVYFLSYTALTGLMFYLTLLYQNVDGWSPLETGLSWMAMNIPFLAVTRFTRRLARAWPGWVTVACGCMSSAVGVIVLSTLSPGSPVVTMSVGLALLGLGNGMLMPGVTNVAMRDIPGTSPALASTSSRPSPIQPTGHWSPTRASWRPPTPPPSPATTSQPPADDSATPSSATSITSPRPDSLAERGTPGSRPTGSGAHAMQGPREANVLRPAHSAAPAMGHR